MNAIIEATIYDNITEENGRGEVLSTIRGQEHELATVRAERDEALKLIKHLQYLVEMDDLNALVWYIRKYEVKP